MVMYMKSLIPVIQQCQSPKILVIGDIILDYYHFGTVTRISPEAPIPVIHIQQKRYQLGGAAAVAVSLQTLGAQVTLAGVIGEDYTGAIVKKRLHEKDITSLLITENNRPTTTKTRFIANHHHLLRADEEITDELPEPSEQAFINTLIDVIPSFDLLLLSDYRKGALSLATIKAITTTSAKHDIPIICDPKRLNLTDYTGVTLLTPNRKEAAYASGIELTTPKTWKTAGKTIIESTGCPVVLITLDKDGIFAYFRNGQSIHAKTVSREVVDVTGAGDTLAAALSLILAGKPFNENTVSEAMHIANAACAVSIQHIGVYAVTREDIINSLHEI